MFSRSIIILFCLAVSGAYGCATHFVEIAPTVEPATPLTQSQIVEPQKTESEFSPTYSPELLAYVHEPETLSDEEIGSAPLPLLLSEPPAKTLEKKLVRPDRREIVIKDKLVKGSENSSVGLQSAPGPQADDRLLDLVEKDLDKAVVQVPERRRLEFSKAVTENPKVRYFIKYFSSKRGRIHLETLLTRSGKFMPMISRVLREEGLPEELAYLALIESGFDTSAKSPHGAAGLWQFVPSTARLYGLKINAWVDERRDPVKSTRAAAAYLKDLHGYFGRWYLATAAYNAGQGRIDRAMQKTGAKDFWTLSEKARLSDETRNFVPKFVAVSLIATNPEKYGFDNVTYEKPLAYDEVELEIPLRLEVLAHMAETSVSTIKELNPALLRNATPPRDISFVVKFPADKGEVFAKAYRQLKEKPSDAIEVVTHEVRKGDTLFAIARRYGQAVSALMRFNGLTSPRIRVGQKIKIVLDELRGVLR